MSTPLASLAGSTPRKYSATQRAAVVDSLRQRSVIGLAAVARFASGILMGTALGYYIGESGSEFAAALVYTAYFAGMMLFAPAWGAVADVTGRRRSVLVLGGLGATVAILPLAVADGVAALIGLRALYASFAAAFPPVMLAIVSASGGETRRGRSVGFFNTVRAAGFTGGQLSAGFLLGLLVPARLYLVIAGISLLSTLAVAFVSDPGSRPERDPTAKEVFSEVRRRLLPAVDEREHLRRNGLRWLYVAIAIRNVTVLGVMSLMPVYLPQTLGLSELWMGFVLALNPAGQTAFMYLFGRVADASGRKRLIVLGMAGSAAFAVVAAAATLPSTPAGRFAVAVVAFLLIAAAFSAMTTGALAFIGDVAPENRESELMGLRTTAKGVGGVLGPIVIGGLAMVTSLSAAFAAASLLALLACGIAAVGLTESRGSRRIAASPGDD